MPNTRLRARRLATLAGVLAVLVLGAGAIRAAADWTAASAPLAGAPISVVEWQSRLAEEQARSAALNTQLDALAGRSADLESALSEANLRIAADTAHAAELEAQLEAATTKLAALERTMATARSATTRVGATSAAAPATGGDHEEHEGHDD